jgi:NTP pyrophosphatase (non-canonical NTP hydrolase)
MTDQPIRAVQAATWKNKLAKGFNTTDVPMEFGLLTAEVSEAFTAWRKGLPDFGEELADVFLYLAGLAEMTGVDLAAEVEAKLAVNAGRVYERAGNGALVRTTAAHDGGPSVAEAAADDAAHWDNKHAGEGA